MALDWTDLDDRISKLQALLDVFLPALIGHGLHVLYSQKGLFSEISHKADFASSSLTSDEKIIATRLLEFFRRYYQ